jgi:hypothetical protein
MALLRPKIVKVEEYLVLRQTNKDFGLWKENRKITQYINYPKMRDYNNDKFYQR